MDYEKVLFRVHEFCLGRDMCKSFLSITSKICLIYVFFAIPFLLYGNYTFIGESPCLQPLLQEGNYMTDPYMKQNKSNTTFNLILPQDIVRVSIADELFAITFEFSGADSLLLLNDKNLAYHNFTFHNFEISSTCYSTSDLGRSLLHTMLGFDVILINEIITVMNGFDIHIRNPFNKQYFTFPNSQVAGILNFRGGIGWPIRIALNLIQILFGLFTMFTVTAIAIRVLFQYLPVWLFLGTNRDSAIQREVIRQYSWIGIFFHTLQQNRKSIIWIFIGLYMFQILFVKLKEAVELYWRFLLFDNKNVLLILIAEFYGFVYCLEFISFLFLRTRTSLKYVPRYTMLILLIFFYYYQHTVYGFYALAFSIVKWSTFAIFFLFILNVEAPALFWNPSHHYTPKLESPRTLYFPIFSTTWIHDLPPVWTMFYPLFGRDHFSSRELALVDGNYALLAQTFEDAHQRAAGENQGFYADQDNQNQDPQNQIGIDLPPVNQDNNLNNTQQNLL